MLYRGPATKVTRFSKKLPYWANQCICDVFELFLGISDLLNTPVQFFFASDAGKYDLYLFKVRGP